MVQKYFFVQQNTRLKHNRASNIMVFIITLYHSMWIQYIENIFSILKLLLGWLIKVT